MEYNKDRHDVGITRLDGNTIGLMLSRDTKSMRPSYFVDDDEYTAQQQTQQAGYDGLPYEKEIRLGQDDWRGGFGQEIYDVQEPNRYNYTTGVDARFAHKLLASPVITHLDLPAGGTHGNQTCIEEFNSKIYFSAGTWLMRIDSDETVHEVKDMTETILSIKAFTDGNLYIALGAGAPYEYMDTSENFTASNAAVHHFYLFEVLDADVPTMYGKDSANTVRTSPAPTNGGTAWSVVTTVDTSEWAITALKSIQSQLYVMKGNRPFYLDTSGDVKTLTTMTQTLATSNGGTGIIEAFGRVYMPYGRAILEYDIANTAFDWKQPAAYGGGFSGTTTALSGDDRYLYMAMQSGTSTYIFAGHDEIIGNSAQWVWHVIAWESTMTTYTCLLSNYIGSSKRLWLGTSSSSGIYYVTIPSEYGDVPNDSTYAFRTGGSLITSWLHGEFKGDHKAFISFTITMGHEYNANVYWTIDYQLFGDADWTTLGDFRGSATSMTQTKSFPASERPSKEMVRFRFTAVTDDVSITPILTSYYCKAILYPKRRNIIRCIVKCGDRVTDKTGQLTYGKRDIKDALIEIKDKADFPIVFYDIDGEPQYCKVLPQKPYFEVLLYENGKPAEENCYLNLQIVEL